jgi:hypothetical protein
MRRSWISELPPKEQERLQEIAEARRKRLKEFTDNTLSIINADVPGYQKIVISYKNIQIMDMLMWCRDSFGPCDDWEAPERRWFTLYNQFYFRNEEDLTMFKLVWL